MNKMEELVEAVESRGPQRHGEPGWEPFVASLCPAVFSSGEMRGGCSHCSCWPNNWVLPHFLLDDQLDRARGAGVASTQEAEMGVISPQVLNGEYVLHSA